MKIVHIITRFILGGAQENTLLTVEGLQKKNYDVTLITGPVLSPEGSLLELAKKKEIKLILIPQLRREINLYYDIIAFLKIFFLLKKNKYDIIHTHSSKAGVLGRIAAKLSGMKIIIHTIHGLPFHEYQTAIARLFFIYCEKLCAKISTKIITVAHVMAEKTYKAGICKKDKFITIRSGMELENFQNVSINKERIKEKLGIFKKQFVIGKIARLFELKGHKYLIKAAEEIIKKIPQVVFLLIGDGILKEKLKKEIEEKKMNSYFIFYGLAKREEIPELINICDIIVHTSLREGLARVLVQALAMAKPVITFDIDGAKEVIINQQTGILIFKKDTKALTEAVIKLYYQQEARRKLGENGKLMVLKEFTVEKMVNSIVNVYKKEYELYRQ